MFPPKPRSKTKPDKIRVKHPIIFKFNVVTLPLHMLSKRGVEWGEWGLHWYLFVAKDEQHDIKWNCQALSISQSLNLSLSLRNRDRADTIITLPHHRPKLFKCLF